MLTLRISQRRRVLATLLLLPVLALRAVIPAGFMPGTHSGLGIAMQLCTSQGMQTVIVNPDGTVDPGAPASHHESPCAYSVLGNAAPPPAPQLAGIVFLPAHSPAIGRQDRAPARPFERAHAARGPPRLV